MMKVAGVCCTESSTFRGVGGFITAIEFVPSFESPAILFYQPFDFFYAALNTHLTGA